MLTDCVIESSVPASALSLEATISGGEFTTKVQLNGFHWCHARLERVTFRGRFRNNRFGHLPEYGPRGAVEDCDFSAATLDDCEFYDCNVDSLRYPNWPHITAVHPQLAQTQLESQSLSPDLEEFFEFLTLLDDDCAAIVHNVEKLGLHEGFPYDELRAVVARVPNLH